MWSMMGTPVVTAFGTACHDLIDVCHVISRLWVVPRRRQASGYPPLVLTSFVGTVCMLMFRVVSISGWLRGL